MVVLKFMWFPTLTTALLTRTLWLTLNPELMVLMVWTVLIPLVQGSLPMVVTLFRLKATPSCLLFDVATRSGQVLLGSARLERSALPLLTDAF